MSCKPICDCDLSFGNTGGDCTLIQEVTRKVLMQPVYDSTGTRNYIDLTTTLNAAYFSNMINDTDVSQRLFPLPEMKEVKDEREDPIMETFADGSSIFVRDGLRKFTGRIKKKNATRALKRAIDSGRCGDMGMYLVDRLGNIWGILSDDHTKLYPIRLDSESLNSKWLNATDTTTQEILFMVMIHADEEDGCIGGISYSELGGADPLSFAGLKTVYAEYTTPSTTGVVVKLYTDFGTPINPKTVQGLTAPSFISAVGGATSKVRNATDAADVAVTVTESTVDPGTYTLAWTAQTVADVIIIKPTLTGYDFILVEEDTVTIP